MMTNHESIGETKDDGSELSDNDGNTYAKKFAVVVLFFVLNSIYFSLLLSITAFEGAKVRKKSEYCLVSTKKHKWQKPLVFFIILVTFSNYIISLPKALLRHLATCSLLL